MRWQRVCARGAALAAVSMLAACSGGDDATIAEPTVLATQAPSPFELPRASASGTAPSAEPSGSQTGDAQGDDTQSNDADEGVAFDGPVTAPTPTRGADVARAEMMLTSWGIEGDMLDAAAVVEGVVVDDGTCELLLTQGGNTLAATGDAVRSASSTDCAQGLRVPVSGESGAWELTITFLADGYEGATEPVEVELP